MNDCFTDMGFSQGHQACGGGAQYSKLGNRRNTDIGKVHWNLDTREDRCHCASYYIACKLNIFLGVISHRWLHQGRTKVDKSNIFTSTSFCHKLLEVKILHELIWKKNWKFNWLIDWLIDWFDFWCFNPTFNNISAISWRPVLVVEEDEVPGENHRPWASNW
jgi:hypothetical protein